MKRWRAWRALAALFVLAATALTLASLVRRTSFAEIEAALRSANRWDIVLYGTLVMVVGFVFRAARFRSLVRDDHGHHPPLGQVLSAVILSQAANNVLPLRAGELVRTHEFQRRAYPLLRIGMAQVVEKGIELASILVVTGTAVALGVLGHISKGVLLCLSSGLLLLGFVCVRLPPVRAWVGRATAWSPADLAASFAWAVLADAAEIGQVAVCLHALGLSAGLGASVAIFAAVNIAIALPGAPGHLGALEAGAAGALSALGTPSERALAFAVVYRVVQWVPLMLAGGAIAVGRRCFPASRTQVDQTELAGGKSV